MSRLTRIVKKINLLFAGFEISYMIIMVREKEIGSE